jgi:hypothetical protein
MKNRERGQALIMVTFSIAFLLGMIGLAVDLGWSYYRIQAAQAAAESAALAASVAVLQNATITCGNSICQAALPCAANPTAPPADNIASGCLYAKANGFVNAGQQTVQIAANLTNPPTATGISTLYWVTATVTERNVQLFSGLFGNHTFGSVAAQATAGVFQGTTPNCIYVMDRTASQALMLSGSNSIIQTNCGVYVNSNSASAVVVNGQGKLNAPTVNIVGSYQSCTNGQDCLYSLRPVRQPTAIRSGDAGESEPGLILRRNRNHRKRSGDFKPRGLHHEWGRVANQQCKLQDHGFRRHDLQYVWTRCLWSRLVHRAVHCQFIRTNFWNL